ncbi:hypothetical protein HRbin33_01297 [bacterium HR33]|nr:hypothetical protein HRbin33_01297 [bacterium HR33]
MPIETSLFPPEPRAVAEDRTARDAASRSKLTPVAPSLKPAVRTPKRGLSGERAQPGNRLAEDEGVYVVGPLVGVHAF